jgi:hypothetical protein
MDAWVDAIQKVKEVQANKALKSQLEEIKNSVAAFASVYDTSSTPICTGNGMPQSCASTHE